MLYWISGPGPASWLYTSLVDGSGRRLPAGKTVTVPTGFLLCGRDISVPPPDSVIRRIYNMVWRTDVDEAGHFAAFEKPDLFVEEVRRFFRAFG